MSERDQESQDADEGQEKQDEELSDEDLESVSGGSGVDEEQLSSDLRLKRHVKPITGVMERLRSS